MTGRLGRYVKSIVVLGLIGLCTIMAYVLVHHTTQNKVRSGDVTITYTNLGFDPKMITVRQGVTIHFVSKRSGYFWPASNFHPSHYLYPEFDAKEPISASDSWSIRLDRVGKWRYHDHLNPRFTGTIVVIDERGGVFDTRCQDSAYLAGLAGRGQISCWQQHLEYVKQTEGVTEAFALFKRLYRDEPSFGANCHDVMHTLGEAVYEDYKRSGIASFPKETSYCGWGFYHGFIEAALFSGEDFVSVERLCRSADKSIALDIDVPLSIYSCYHGFGHGVVDTLASDMWGNDAAIAQAGTNVCTSVIAEDESGEFIKQCVTGVYNSIANAYETNYGLFQKQHDPAYICALEKTPLFKQACYGEIALRHITNNNLSESQGLAFIYSLSEEIGRQATMFTYMGELVRLNLQQHEPSHWSAVCGNQPTHLVASCIQGTAQGYLGWGDPGMEYVSALALCEEASTFPSAQEACYEYVLPRLNTIYTKQKSEELCARAPVMYQHFCINRSTL